MKKIKISYSVMALVPSVGYGLMLLFKACDWTFNAVYIVGAVYVVLSCLTLRWALKQFVKGVFGPSVDIETKKFGKN